MKGRHHPIPSSIAKVSEEGAPRLEIGLRARGVGEEAEEVEVTEGEAFVEVAVDAVGLDPAVQGAGLSGEVGPVGGVGGVSRWWCFC